MSFQQREVEEAEGERDGGKVKREDERKREEGR